MKIITIAEKIYGDIDRAIKALEAALKEQIGGLEVRYRAYPDEAGWAIVEIMGEDEEVAANYLREEYGAPADHVEAGGTYKGRVERIDTDELLVDVGVPVVIPSLGELGPGTIEQVAERFGLVEKQPIEIVITEVDGIPMGRLSKRQADQLWAWRKGARHCVVVNGATRSQVKAALRKKGHGKDVLGVERLGLLEQVIVCKEGTEAPGIIASIGPLLQSEMKAIIPR